MPENQLYLHKGVPLDPRYEHTLTWKTQADQLTYLNTDAHFFRGYSDFTYLRKDSAVRVPHSLAELENNDVNYVSMLNEDDDRWRFYFIVDKRYKADQITELVLELDVLQTYQFDWEIPACFVEREHVNDDTIGANLVDEGLELGELVVDPNTSNKTFGLTDLAIVVLSSFTMQNPMGVPVVGSIINGVYCGLKLYCRTADELGATVINAAISALDTAGKTDGIFSIFMYPKSLILADWDNENAEVMLEVKGMQQQIYYAGRPTSLNGYIPHNNKLFTFPYTRLYAHNGMGESAEYHFEHFTGPEYIFAIAGSCSQDGVVRMVPCNHRGRSYDNEAGLSLTGYPNCAWKQDAYKIWLAQNQNQQALAIHGGEWTQGMGLANGVIGLFSSAASANMGGMVSSVAGAVDSYHSGYMQIQSVMAQRSDKAVQPPQARGTHSSSTNIGLGIQSFFMYGMTIRKDAAERIDQYFDMYGYKVNKVKKPNITGRIMWNYVKTIGAVVLGGFDSADRIKIAAILDKGITFWHDPAVMYHYEMGASNWIDGWDS